MLHACVQRFDVTKNLKKFYKILVTKQAHSELRSLHHLKIAHVHIANSLFANNLRPCTVRATEQAFRRHLTCMHASRFGLGFFCTHPFLHMQCVRATFPKKPFIHLHLDTWSGT